MWRLHTEVKDGCLLMDSKCAGLGWLENAVSAALTEADGFSILRLSATGLWTHFAEAEFAD